MIKEGAERGLGDGILSRGVGVGANRRAMEEGYGFQRKRCRGGEGNLKK